MTAHLIAEMALEVRGPEDEALVGCSFDEACTVVKVAGESAQEWKDKQNKAIKSLMGQMAARTRWEKIPGTRSHRLRKAR